LPDGSTPSSGPSLENPEMGYRFASPGGTGFTARRFLKGTQKYTSAMSRLAAMDSPPGGFWKFYRNSNFNKQQSERRNTRKGN